MTGDALLRLRRRVDRINDSLLNLLQLRGQYVRRIGWIKRIRGIELRDPGREHMEMARMIAKNEGPYLDQEIEKLFETIFRMSTALMTRQRPPSSDGAMVDLKPPFATRAGVAELDMHAARGARFVRIRLSEISEGDINLLVDDCKRRDLAVVGVVHNPDEKDIARRVDIVQVGRADRNILRTAARLGVPVLLDVHLMQESQLRSVAETLVSEGSGPLLIAVSCEGSDMKQVRPFPETTVTALRGA